ncbi:MAG: metallophosphoesterase [Acidobacteriia bacterium]|nr:metallophosphoesterase [Terriglobia bacterium]
MFSLPFRFALYMGVSPIMKKSQSKFALAAAPALLLAGFVFTGARSGAQSPAEDLIKGPLVQNVQKDRATLTWVTRKSAGQYSKESGGPQVPISEEIYHQLELTKLEPGTRYQYSLSPYGTDASGTFCTAPSSNETPFDFVIFGDTRTGHEVHRKIVAKIIKDQPAFVVHTGDLVDNGNQAGLWDTFFEIEKDLLRNIPFYPTPGNHEQNTPVFFKYFAFSNDDGHHYSFDWGGTHFAAIDSNEIGKNSQERTAFRQEQLDWLQGDLARNSNPLVFVWLHHPVFSGVADRKAASARLAAVLEPVLLKGRAAAVFGGHDHNYQHHVHAGIDYVVSGGGGAPLYNLSPTPETMVKGVVADNYVRVHVKGTTAQFEAVDLDGKVLDSFEVKARAAK